MDTVVVGVDGSDCARAAREAAAQEAALRNGRLRIVSAWDIAPAVYSGGFAPGFDQETIDAFRESAETVVRDVSQKQSGFSRRWKLKVARAKVRRRKCS